MTQQQENERNNNDDDSGRRADQVSLDSSSSDESVCIGCGLAIVEHADGVPCDAGSQSDDADDGLSASMTTTAGGDDNVGEGDIVIPPSSSGQVPVTSQSVTTTPQVKLVAASPQSISSPCKFSNMNLNI